MKSYIRKSEIIGCRTMAYIIIVSVLISLITFIDAEMDTKTINDNIKPIEAKRAGFLPSRGRRFWSIFNWDDRDGSGEKRAGFLPMRGRKAGFLPMRGKKSVDNYPMDDYIDTDSLNYGYDSGSDYIPMEYNKRASFMAMRGKKMNDNYEELDMNKRSRNFFGMRG